MVHFNEYVGNFNREFIAFVFGYDSYTHDWITNLYDLAVIYYDGHGVDIDELQEIYHHGYDEYGNTISNIVGKDATAIEIHFVQDPTPWIKYFEERMLEFSTELAKSWEFAPGSVKVVRWEWFAEQRVKVLLSTSLPT